jgi:predicted permease
MGIFFNSFSSLFQSILMISLIALVAGLMVRKNIITDEHVRGLSLVTINILLPCLIFSKITTGLHPREFPIWWMIPLIAMGTTGIGFALAWIFWRKQLPEKRNLLPMSALMNAAYFTLPIGKMIYPEQFDEFAMYVALYVMGISPIVWSFGKFLVTDPEKNKQNWMGLLTPPLIANAMGLFFVFTGLRNNLPHFISDGIELLGQATVPIATLILGATLGILPWKFKPHLRDLSASVFIKLIAVPAIVFFILYRTPLVLNYPLLGKLLILEAAAPAATALIIQIRRYGGNKERAGTILLFSYFACLLLIPIWLALWTSLHP